MRTRQKTKRYCKEFKKVTTRRHSWLTLRHYNFKPERIDFLSIADLNADGNPDVLAAASGGGLYVLMGSRTWRVVGSRVQLVWLAVLPLWQQVNSVYPMAGADIAVGVDRSGWLTGFDFRRRFGRLEQHVRRLFRVL